MKENKALSTTQIAAAAESLGVTTAALRAVIDVECRGSGFLSDGQPVILFERHVFLRQLQAKKLTAVADVASKTRPDLCNKTAGGYGPISAQHGRLQAAVAFDRDSALESASWGLGQVMGYHWQSLGYPSLQDFVNAMYQSEALQLDAMCRYIKVNGLAPLLRNLAWAQFARRYNGPAYRENQYDQKLAAAYQRFSG